MRSDDSLKRLVWKPSQPLVPRYSTLHCLLRFRYSVTASILRSTHVSMEQAIGTTEETMVLRLVATTAVNQMSTSLGPSQIVNF